jgi:hypothetical protein
VVWQLADLSKLFVGDAAQAAELDWVWRLAACQRGFDCSQTAEWYRVMCRSDPNCQPYETGVDFIRRLRADDFAEIERRAADLNAKIDAGRFDELGI